MAVLAILSAAAALLGAASPARADTIITVCDEANLSAALAAGGVITFDCNNVNDTATIQFTGSKSVAVPTKVDGGGRITLQGGNFNGSMIYVDPGASLRVQAIALNGNTTTGLSGGAFYNNGTLELVQVDITGMNVGGANGGAIYSAGPLTLTRSALIFNYAGYGGAIRAGAGSVHVENSTIAFNYASAASPLAGNGVYLDAGVPLTAVNATIAYNAYSVDGANIVVDGGALTLRNTLLQNSGYVNITRTTGSVTSLGYNLADDSSGFLSAAGDINGAEIKIDYDQGIEAALFVLIHLFGHTVQWNTCDADRELGLSTEPGKSEEELALIYVYERDATRYSLSLLHDIGVWHLDRWASDWWYADWLYLQHFYRTGQKLHAPSLLRPDEGALLTPLAIPPFTPQRFVSRWSF
jgi:hypothetical protein